MQYTALTDREQHLPRVYKLPSVWFEGENPPPKTIAWAAVVPCVRSKTTFKWFYYVCEPIAPLVISAHARGEIKRGDSVIEVHDFILFATESVFFALRVCCSFAFMRWFFNRAHSGGDEFVKPCIRVSVCVCVCIPVCLHVLQHTTKKTDSGWQRR